MSATRGGNHCQSRKNLLLWGFIGIYFLTGVRGANECKHSALWDITNLTRLSTVGVEKPGLYILNFNHCHLVWNPPTPKLYPVIYTRTNARMHTRTHTHAHTHARAHASINKRRPFPSLPITVSLNLICNMVKVN